MTFEDVLSRGGAKVTSGEEMRKQAMRWRHDNLAAWSEMKRIANEFANEGRRFSIDYLAEQARYRMQTVGEVDGFKVNNNLRAPLARLLVKECPHLERFIEMRRSKVDWA